VQVASAQKIKAKKIWSHIIWFPHSISTIFDSIIWFLLSDSHFYDIQGKDISVSSKKWFVLR
jgi:hypothetical protein